MSQLMSRDGHHDSGAVRKVTSALALDEATKIRNEIQWTGRFWVPRMAASAALVSYILYTAHTSVSVVLYSRAFCERSACAVPRTVALIDGRAEAQGPFVYPA
jgi:hypothetical protein